MANNFISYNRFTALPPVISRFGWTAEEAESTRGKPDPNPMLSPMPSVAVPETRLALAPGGSDKLRLNTPLRPEVNPFEGPKPTLVHSRNVARKLSGNVVGEIQRLVQGGAVADGNLQALMSDSIRRVAGLREFLGHLNSLTEGVYARSLATSKG